MFVRALQGGYLDTAAEGLPAPGVAATYSEYLREKEVGTPGRRRHFEKEAEARELAARLLGAPVADVAFAPSASDALNILAASLELRAGDEIVITDLEFPSNVLPWLALRRRGVQVHVVQCPDGCIPMQELAAKINQRTRLVSVSLVSYKSGAYFPCTVELSRMAHDVGAVLCVDATQALGRCPVPLDGIDYLMSSTFKWLMGPHGLAVVYVSPAFRERFEPIGVGWYSVESCFTPDRFERYTLKPGAACIAAGMPNFGSLYAMCEALKFVLSLDHERERQRVNALCLELRRNLAALGLKMLTPADPSLVSGIVAFEHEHAVAIASALEERGITVWGGDNRVRASVHFYNDETDTAALVSALPHVLEQVKYAG
jgi:Selenocysteine lyase